MKTATHTTPEAKEATMFLVTKTFETGSLAGLTITEKTGVEMPVGEYRCCVTGARYQVVSCETA